MSHPEPAADRRSLLQSSLLALEAMEAKLAAAEQARSEPIAVVGMSCRFPGGVDTPEGFWQLLREGRDAVSELPPDRLKIAAAFGVEPDADPDKPVWRGGFVEHIDQFEPQVFGITPREALTMDPQQRLVLEVAWEALERAGIAPDSLAGSRSGVFLGISTNDYGDIVRQQGYEHIDAYAATGGSMNVAAGRVAFVLGLQGPALAVDTACSSSLVAVHLAVQSLRNRESTLALAGGVNVVLMPDGFVSFSSWGMMAADGHCKAFDARARRSDGRISTSSPGRASPTRRVPRRRACRRCDRRPAPAAAAARRSARVGDGQRLERLDQRRAVPPRRVRAHAQVRALARRHRHDRMRGEPEPRDRVGHRVAHRGEAVLAPVREVHLVDGDDDVAHAEQSQQREMAPRLRLARRSCASTTSSAAACRPHR